MSARKNKNLAPESVSKAPLVSPGPSVLARLKEEFSADLKVRMASLLGDRVSRSNQLEESPRRREFAPRLDDFHVGESNMLAYRAAKELCRTSKPSPLLLLGGNGTGKTHLLRGMAAEIEDQGMRPLFVRAVDLREQLKTALRRRRAAELKSLWREHGALLIDDLHLIASAPVTLEEVSHLVAFFLDEARPVAVTADRHPAEFLRLPRLISRLGSGLVAVVAFPESELKIEMIRRLAHSSDLPLERGELESLAASVQTYPQIASLVSERQLSRPATRTVTLDEVVRVTAEIFGITESQLLGSSRRPEFAAARHAAMILSLKHANATRTAIARFFGKKDHTSVVHAEKKLQERLQIPGFKKNYLHAERLLHRE